MENAPYAHLHSSLLTHICKLNAISNLFLLQNEHLNTQYDGFYQIAAKAKRPSLTHTEASRKQRMPPATVSRRKSGLGKKLDFHSEILYCARIPSLSFRPAKHGSDAHFGVG